MQRTQVITLALLSMCIKFIKWLLLYVSNMADDLTRVPHRCLGHPFDIYLMDWNSRRARLPANPPLLAHATFTALSAAVRHVWIEVSSRTWMRPRNYAHPGLG